MIKKSNLGKALGRMAPRGNMPQGGLSMAAPRTGYRMPQNPMMAVPHPIVDTPENIQRMPRPRGLADAGSMLAKFAEQFRNAETVQNTRPGMFGGMQPRALTPEEAMSITSMPATGTRMMEPPRYMPAPVPKMQTMSPTINEVIQPIHRDPVPVAAQPMPNIVVQPRPNTPQPFDPNAALQTFNKRAAELNASGNGLFNSGVSPDEFRMYQGVLRNLQLNPNSTPEQHADILNKSMAFLNQYSGATPQPMVDPNVPYRPTGPDAFYGAPPAPLQQTPQNARGMALGGLMAKYRGGMC